MVCSVPPEKWKSKSVIGTRLEISSDTKKIQPIIFQSFLNVFFQTIFLIHCMFSTSRRVTGALYGDEAGLFGEPDAGHRVDQLLSIGVCWKILAGNGGWESFEKALPFVEVGVADDGGLPVEDGGTLWELQYAAGKISPMAHILK